MHELSIALNLIELAEEEAARQGAKRVVGIHVRLGPLSGVVKEALLSAFELAREDSEMENARLVIEDVPVTAYCPTCQTTRQMDSIQLLCCPTCGAPTPEVTGGRELEMVALEIE